MRCVILLAQREFSEDELYDTASVLEENNVDIKIASATLAMAIGKLGEEMKPDFKFSEIETGMFDAIVLIGGPGAYDLINNEEVHAIVKKFYDANKLVAAVCIAPAILAKAGILKNKKATVHSSGEEFLTKAGAINTEKDVEVDGNIITASSPAAASRFGMEIVKYLKNKSNS